MNKNIVIFGCDNSGKTSLCERLQCELSRISYTEIKKSLGKGKRVDEYIGFMRENLSKNCITIFDRFPIIEEGTTGVILRHENVFDLVVDQRKLFDDIFGKVDVFIYCYPGVDSILNWNGREQMEGIIENVNRLVPAYLVYCFMLKRYGYNVLEWNYTSDLYSNSIDKFTTLYWVSFVNEIKKYLEVDE